MGDLLTLRQMQLPVKVVVFNNGVLGFVELEMKAVGLPRIRHRAATIPDFATMAQAAGMHAHRVEDPGDLEAALHAAFAHDGPALVDVVTRQAGAGDAAEDRGRARSRASASGRCQAVMNGRGDEADRARAHQPAALSPKHDPDAQLVARNQPPRSEALADHVPGEVRQDQVGAGAFERT